MAVTIGCTGSAAAGAIGGAAAIPAVVAIAVCDLALTTLALRRRGHDAAHGIGERLERGFDDAAIGMMLLSSSLIVTRVNGALCTLLGRTQDELLGHSILEFTVPEDVGRSLEKLETMKRGDGDRPLDKRYLRPDGTIVEAVVIATLVDPDVGEPYFFSQLQDVTEQRRGERQRAAIAELGHRALETSDALGLIGEAMATVRKVLDTDVCITTRRMTDGEFRVVASDGPAPAMKIPAGQPSQSLHTLEVREPVICNDLLGETRFAVPPFVVDDGLRRSLSVPVPERSGLRHAILAHGRPTARPFTVDDARFLEAVAHVIGDALDRAETEQELRRRALEDPLTGLANRALLASQLGAELRHARRMDHHVAVLALDLDRFKIVNEALGHEAGDSLLRQVAARVGTCVREEDLVARPGADEFTIVCTRTDTDHAITEVAQRLVDVLVDPFEVSGQEVFMTASVGLAVSERGEETPEELLRDADAAMFRAKELGGNRFEAFDVTLRNRLVERMTIEGDLRHAVERNQLRLHYQPLIDLEHERTIGFEALLRWRHPDRGLVAPDEFVHIAEETGLIIPIGSWVLRTVCAQLAEWPESIHVSANLSPVQIRPELVREVERCLTRHRVAPERLVLEITESLVLDPRTKPIVSSLRALGVRLALDDFGTGYSSLGSLQRFPLDVVKLDRTLIASIVTGKGVAVVRAAVELGRALGVEVVAEGIESPAQLRTLRELDCPVGQGFLFAKPLPVDEARQRLDSGGDAAAA